MTGGGERLGFPSEVCTRNKNTVFYRPVTISSRSINCKVSLNKPNDFHLNDFVISFYQNLNGSSVQSGDLISTILYFFFEGQFCLHTETS